MSGEDRGSRALEPNPLCARLCNATHWCRGCPVYRECHAFCAVLTGDAATESPREHELRERYNAAVRAWKASGSPLP